MIVKPTVTYFSMATDAGEVSIFSVFQRAELSCISYVDAGYAGT